MKGQYAGAPGDFGAPAPERKAAARASKIDDPFAKHRLPDARFPGDEEHPRIPACDAVDAGNSELELRAPADERPRLAMHGDRRGAHIALSRRRHVDEDSDQPVAPAVKRF